MVRGKINDERETDSGVKSELDTSIGQEYYIKTTSSHSSAPSELSTEQSSETSFVENKSLMSKISNMADLIYGRLDGIEKEKQMAIVKGEDRPSSDPKAIPKGIASSKISELEKEYGKEKVTEHINQYVSREINEMSDEVPNSPALDNKFFRNWVSEDTMSPEQTHLMLNEYLAITAMTANAVAQTYSVSRNSEQKKRTVMNLAEESGVPLAGEGSDAGSKESDSVSEAKPHLELLYTYANGVMGALGKETSYSEDNRYEKDMLLPSTERARDDLQALYTGKSVSLNGTNDTSIKGEHGQYIDSAVAAISLAHESKAPGMLLGVFLSNAKHAKAVQNPSEEQVEQNREYFDEHLGVELVDRSIYLFGNKGYLSKEFNPSEEKTQQELRQFSDNFASSQPSQEEGDQKAYNFVQAVSSMLLGNEKKKADATELNFEGFQKVMLDENELVKNMSAQECRDRGFVEQAHRRDACSNFVEAVMAYGSNTDRMMAFVEGKNAFNQFLDKVQGKFWDGLAEGVAEVGVDKEVVNETSMKRAFSYGDYEKIKSRSPVFSRRESDDSKEEDSAVGRLEGSRGDNHKRSGSVGNEFEGRNVAHSALQRIEERRSQQFSKSK